MQLKYFDIEENIWKPIELAEGESLVSNGNKGFINVNLKPYKVYSAIFGYDVAVTEGGYLIQELENSLAPGITPEFRTDTTGEFTIRFNDLDSPYLPLSLFTNNRTHILINMWGDDAGTPLSGAALPLDTQIIRFQNTNSYSVMNYIAVEIRVYNSEPA